jgi:hypothetical protein
MDYLRPDAQIEDVLAHRPGVIEPTLDGRCPAQIIPGLPHLGWIPVMGRIEEGHLEAATTWRVRRSEFDSMLLDAALGLLPRSGRIQPRPGT